MILGDDEKKSDAPMFAEGETTTPVHRNPLKAVVVLLCTHTTACVTGNSYTLLYETKQPLEK